MNRGRAAMVQRAFYLVFWLVFWLAGGAQHWIGRRFTPAGRFVLVALSASAVVGFDTYRTMAYQAFTLLAALLALALVSSLRFRTRFEARRLLPRYATVGEPLAYGVAVRSRGETVERGLVLGERLADPRPSFEEFWQARVPGEEEHNWWDRSVGYPRWLWLVADNRDAVAHDALLPAMPAGGETEVRCEIVPRRRGPLRFTGLAIARPDPFGLVQAVVAVPAAGSVLVLPRRYPVPPLQLPGGRRHQPGGVTPASSVGDAQEFVSLREYRPGDPLRRLHWRSWARVGKPVVREYQDEFFVRHGLVLDTFLGARRRDLFEEAVSVAASFAWTIQTQESLLDLLFVGAETYCFTVGRGLGHAERMLEVLACVRPCGDRPFRALQDAVLGRRAALSGVVAVLLGWDAERRAFVDHLRSAGVPARAFVVTEPGGSDPDPSGPGVHRLEVGRVPEGLARL